MLASSGDVLDRALDTTVPSRPDVVAVGALTRSGSIAAAADVRLVPETFDDVDDAHAVSLLLDLDLARGSLGDARRLLPALTTLERSGRAATEAVAQHARGRLALAEGRVEAALVHLESAALLTPDADPVWLGWQTDYAPALVRVGRTAEAERVGVAYERSARAHGSDHAVASALRVRAMVTLIGDRIAMLDEALEHAERAGSRGLAATIGCDLASLLLLPGDAERDRAVALLHAAEQYATVEGASPLLGRVHRLFDRCGAEPGLPGGSPSSVLTDAEHRAALLAARGLTNRQVATQLDLTVRAVEWQLTCAYRKLGIRTRRQLAGRLGV
ncbi:helix-turn-helix transcriptional regulator [Nocardioides acrostichi]|uniref:Helix-turn-helix transcriptional regulator n=1 Tax=Nocardioides acrostichi TaxID=2784339 RepID=A0A930UWR1_9ACTN|nr:LuxR C-terminal-related transcriptional regulator [Nocardioides acrostichi]MBF4161082.1 helix-turn-helix transcriptional regulator [Nocardioides acrostichi]